MRDRGSRVTVRSDGAEASYAGREGPATAKPATGLWVSVIRDHDVATVTIAARSPLCMLLPAIPPGLTTRLLH